MEFTEEEILNLAFVELAKTVDSLNTNHTKNCKLYIWDQEDEITDLYVLLGDFDLTIKEITSITFCAGLKPYDNSRTLVAFIQTEDCSVLFLNKNKKVSRTTNTKSWREQFNFFKNKIGEIYLK